MQFAEEGLISIINKIRSFIGTILVGIFTIIMPILAIILMMIFGKQIFHSLAYFWANFLLKILGINLIIDGIEKLDKNKSYILCANHSSMLDIPVLLISTNQKVRIIYKKELEKIPIFGWCLKLSPFIAIKRQNARDSMSGIDEAVRAINSGESVGIFPEGTRSDDGKLQQFKRGAFLLASRSNKEIVPLSIIGSSKLLPNKKFLSLSGTIKVVISDPIVYTGSNKSDELNLLNQVHSTINSYL